MQSKQKKKVILLIKRSEIKTNDITKQTKTMRDAINCKIRDFGQKFYDVKNILEQMDIHRDILFKVGKELEVEYKNIKAGISLQSKLKRMKDAILCWYCDYFYDEIMSKNSYILMRLNAAQVLYNIQFNQKKVLGYNIISNIKQNKNPNKNDINDENPQKMTKDNSILSFMKTNTEIDDFQFSNSNNRIEEQKRISDNIFNDFNF